MVVTIKEDKKTLEYKETMNVNIEKKIGDKYMKLLIIRFLKETKLFPTAFLNQCRNNPNEPQNIPS